MRSLVNEGEKSRRPKDTNVYQQRLKAWKPVLTTGSVFPFFLVCGIVFIAIGAVLLVTSNNVIQKFKDYTDCEGQNGTRCAEQITKTPNETCTCVVNITLDTDMKGQVYLFYGLDNYYQNHRRYVRSRDDYQLLGREPSADGECAKEGGLKVGNLTIAPCGFIANSLFNDSFKLTYLKDNANTEVPLNNKGIAWSSDVERKFGKPTSWAGTTKPRNWPKPVYEMNPEAYSGFEELIVWMRPAPLPNFLKLHRLVKMENDFKDGLPKGTYSLTIDYNYPVKVFNGKKKIVLSTMSWMGGKNPVLGIAYIVTGCIHVVLAVVFLIIHRRVSRRDTYDFT